MAKKISLNVAQKLSVGFGIIAGLFLIVGVFTFYILQSNKTTTIEITNQTIPSEAGLKELYALVGSSKVLTRSWVYIDQKSDTPDKKNLQDIVSNKYPKLKARLDNLKKHWGLQQRQEIDAICKTINDSLFAQERIVMEKLKEFDAYSDPMTTMEVFPMVEDNGQIAVMSEQLQKRISALIATFSLKIQADSTEMRKDFDLFQLFILLMSVFVLLITVLIAIYIIKDIVVPVKKVKSELDLLGQGILRENEIANRNDELGDMIRSLHNVTHTLIATADYAHEIGKGNYNSEFKTKGDADVLGNALINLKTNLEAAVNEAEERRKRDKIQSWTTEGIARFADILRQNNSNFREMGKNVIRNLVQYMSINQGGLFVYNDEDKSDTYLELIAVYAYNRDKYAKKQILPGEGLVGTCFVEKQTVYMTEVPNSYLEVTSGLGQANPRSILIVPLKIEEKIMGVIELASFNLFEKYEIEFVEKIGESIAATIQMVRINEETTKLLSNSKQQAEAMHAQEEEMRQSLEEMWATQEEADKKCQQLESALAQAQLEIEMLRSQSDNTLKPAED